MVVSYGNQAGSLLYDHQCNEPWIRL